MKIPLSKGLFVLIDLSDFNLVRHHKWFAHSGAKNPTRFYAGTNLPAGKGKQQSVKMHRLIIGAEKGQIVDHINGNTLDNRRVNLRFATNSQNMANMGLPRHNTTGAKGVFKDRDRWRSRIKVFGKIISLGSFATKQEADQAYQKAASLHFGEFSFHQSQNMAI